MKSSPRHFITIHLLRFLFSGHVVLLFEDGCDMATATVQLALVF